MTNKCSRAKSTSKLHESTVIFVYFSSTKQQYPTAYSMMGPCGLCTLNLTFRSQIASCVFCSVVMNVMAGFLTFLPINVAEAKGNLVKQMATCSPSCMEMKTPLKAHLLSVILSV